MKFLLIGDIPGFFIPDLGRTVPIYDIGQYIDCQKIRLAVFINDGMIPGLRNDISR